MDSPAQSRKLAAAAFALWLGMQLAVLGLSAGRVMLWSRAPRAGEESALLAMLAIQIAAASLLFPYLLGNVRVTILVIVTAWPLGQLAGAVGDEPASAVLRGELYVSLWLISLHIWSRALISDWAKLFFVALASMMSLGGPLLWYLRSEFAGGPDDLGNHGNAVFGPLMGVESQVLPDWPVGAWVFPLVAIFVGGVFIFRFRERNRATHQLIH